MESLSQSNMWDATHPPHIKYTFCTNVDCIMHKYVMHDPPFHLHPHLKESHASIG